MINIIVSNYRNLHKEDFITDYYDKYFNDISVPTKFYETSAKFENSNHYAIEMHDRFFIDILNREKSILPNPNEKYIATLTNKELRHKMLKTVNKYLIDLLNNELFKKSSNEKYIFTNVFSRVKEMYQAIWENGNCIVVTTDHIIYRDTKMYGISLTIKTLHNIKDNAKYIIDYNLNGFVFEDRVKNNVYPSNLIEDSYQDFMKDKIQKYDTKYETKYVCKYLADIKKFRGIQVDTGDLDCNYS